MHINSLWKVLYLLLGFEVVDGITEVDLVIDTVVIMLLLTAFVDVEEVIFEVTVLIAVVAVCDKEVELWVLEVKVSEEVAVVGTIVFVEPEKLVEAVVVGIVTVLVIVVGPVVLIVIVVARIVDGKLAPVKLSQ